MLKTALIIFSFSLLQDIWEYRITHEFSIIEFLKSLYKEPATNRYWFLYLYLAFIITLPFLRYIAVNMTKNEFYFLIVLGVMSGLLPILNLFFASSCFLNLDIVDVNYFYPLIGFYIGKNIDCEKLSKKMHVLLASIAFLSVVISMFLVVFQKHMVGEYSETYLNFCIPYVCVWLFVLFKAIDKSFHRYQRIFIYMGRGTVGVYLLGNILHESFRPVFSFLCGFMIRGLANLLIILLELIVGIVITNMFFAVVNFLRTSVRRKELILGEE